MMRAFRWLLSMLLLASVATALPRSASALKCVPEFREQAFAGADLVFEAEVLAVTRVSREEPQQVRLRLTRVWKGQPESELLLLVDGFKGGYPFAAREHYLVFAVRDGDVLRSRDCGGTVSLEHAGEQLAILERQTAKPKHAAPPPPTSEPPASEPPPTATSEPALPRKPPQPLPAPSKRGGCGACAVPDQTSHDGGVGMLSLLLIAALGRARRNRPRDAARSPTSSGKAS